MFSNTYQGNRPHWHFAVLLAFVSCMPNLAVAAACTPLGFDEARLLQLKSDDFAIVDAQERQRFAIEILGCLGDPNPRIRDGIAYEGLLTLLRGKQLAAETVEILRATLIEQLQPGKPDERGFRQPFVALALAEVARADRIEALFGPDEREEIVAVSTAYMRSIDDYRGFDQTDGWRHGIAHTADLFMQLVLNPALTERQMHNIRAAIGAQVSPAGEHFFIYGEGERLARPLLFMAVRGAFTEQQWLDWFQDLAAADPFDSWDNIFFSQAGLAKLHNTRSFAEAVYVRSVGSDKANVAALAAGAEQLLRALP